MEKREISVLDVRDFFGMSNSEFLKEWHELGDKEKQDFKDMLRVWTKPRV